MVCWLFWDEKLGGQRKLHFVCLHWSNCTGEERHAGGSNRLLEDFETHTRLSHVLYRSNSLCVHRLQVLHCMLVWDWQLGPPHWSMYNVFESWTEPQCGRDSDRGHVYMHRELRFSLGLDFRSLNGNVVTRLQCYIHFRLTMQAH